VFFIAKKRRANMPLVFFPQANLTFLRIAPVRHSNLEWRVYGWETWISKIFRDMKEAPSRKQKKQPTK